MFEGRGRLALEGDHLDISYRRPDTWPNMTPGGSIKAHTFNLGDPEAGPNIQLGIMSTVDGERLDWPHSIDPPHHHGSDQFRVISQGEWTRSEEHTSELQSLMRISYAVYCLKKKNNTNKNTRDS